MPLAPEWHFCLLLCVAGSQIVRSGRFWTPGESTLPTRNPLEVKSYLPRNSTRTNVMRAAEGGQKVIECVVVCEIDQCQLGTPSVPVALKEIVVANSKIEQVAVCDARWILVVIFSSRSRHLSQRRSKLRRRTDERQRNSRRGVHSVAGKSGLKFLIGGQRYASRIGHRDGRVLR